MLRMDENRINLDLLTTNSERAFLLNTVLAVAHMRLTEAANVMRLRLASKGWHVHEGGHHISVLQKGGEPSELLMLFDVEDPEITMVDYPDYLCEERRQIGLPL